MLSKSELWLLIICLALCISAGSSSYILKTQEYSFMNYSRVEGLSYPQEIQYVDTSLSAAFFFTNITSGKTWTNISIVKTMNSSCVWGLVTLDYGYYTKFPYYQIIGDCRNKVAKVLYTVKLYRSGESQLISGDIETLDDAESSCELGKLKVQSYFSSSGSKRMGAYRYCRNPANKTGGSILYKYTPSAKKMQTINETTLQNWLRLPKNYQTIDVIPYLGEQGDFVAVLSPKNNLTISNGKTMATWSPQNNYTIYKMAKICWQNTLAILTENVTYYAKWKVENRIISISNTDGATKTKSIFPKQACNFFSIGRNAICSYDYEGRTSWYINRKDHRDEVEQRFNTTVEQPYVLDDSCESGSFYMKNSRYVLNYQNIKSNVRERKNQLTKRQVGLPAGKVVTFVEIKVTNSIAFVSLNSVNQTMQEVGLFLTARMNQSEILKINIYNASLNISKPQIFAELAVFGNIPDCTYITTIASDYVFGNTFLQSVQSRNSSNYFFEWNLTFQSLPAVSKFNFISNSEDSRNGFKLNAGYTSIQANSIALLEISIDNKFTYSYNYDFEAANFQICVMKHVKSQILLFRRDSDGLVVLRAGFRNQNSFVLDDIRVFSQYKGHTFQCAQNGLLGYNTNTGSILSLDNVFVATEYGPFKFKELKFTKELLILKNDDNVKIYQKGQTVPIISKNWNMQDIVTERDCVGFFNTNERAYYDYYFPNEVDGEDEESESKL